MDSDRFDALTRSLAAVGSRRLALRGFAATAALLGGLALDAAAAHSTIKRCRKIEDKKKRAACVKKAKKHAKGHAGAPPLGGGGRDEAPPCTADGCPLPPGCSQEIFDACAGSLRDAVMAQAEAECQTKCQDPETAECRECVRPIVAASVPDAAACAAEACAPPTAEARASARRGEVSATAWWTRSCPTACCKLEHEQCREDARDVFLQCSVPAVGGAIVAPPAGAIAFMVCVGNYVYEIQRCIARNGCVDGHYCVRDGLCCPEPQVCQDDCCFESQVCCDDGCCWGTCCNGTCCPSGAGKVCEGGTCKCASGRTPCGSTCCPSSMICDGGVCKSECDFSRYGCGG